jgi:hypothetical protein
MRRVLLITALLAFAGITVANAAVITILNNDGVGEGFNDPTPVAPVGGNPGTTIGQQRLNVFQEAATIWGHLIPSTVTIVVRAQFNPQTCTATQAVLGSAGPQSVFADFTGAPVANTWYHVALANKISGVDQNGPTFEINATFNSNLNGNVNCLGGRQWYYGYDGNEGNNLELLPVVLHEMGHGLGFSTLVNSTGAEFQLRPDIYERNIRDNTLGMTWDQMTQAQRAASAINTGNLVWNGFCVTAKSAEVLGPQPTAFVTGAPPAQPKYPTGTASFGPTNFDITGPLALVNDGVGTVTDGCEALVGFPAGSIALIDRGTCTFVIKAQMAQAAGAIAVIIANNVAGVNPPGLGGSDPTITIPVVGVTQAAGNDLKASLLLGPVTVQLAPDPTVEAGSDAAGRVKLYAPNPYEGGSSISHFDVTAFPDLLMEPAINTGLHNTVDLTLPHFTDIGWISDCEPVSVAIAAFAAKATAAGVELVARFYSTLGDANFVIVYRAHAGSEQFSGIASLDAPSNGMFSYVDETALPGRSYRYKIGVIDADGEYLSPTEEVRMPKASIELSQNAPNPFNPSTTIRFTLPASERVGLAIYSASGALVRMLVDETRDRGPHNVTWDGRDSAGNPVGSGVYFYRLTAGKFSDSRKMVLLK